MVVNEILSFHPLVIALMAAGASQWDVESPVRGWGEGLHGQGVTIRDSVSGTTDHFTVSCRMEDLGSGREPCVLLTQQVAAFGPDDRKSVKSWCVPCSRFRSVDVLLPILS